MITHLEILRTIPAFATITLIIHIPLLFILRKYTRIDNFLKFVHVFFAVVIIVSIGLTLDTRFHKIFFNFLIWYWFVPSVGTGIIVGGLYKSFQKSFRKNFYSSFLLMTIFPYTHIIY